jgi:large subunit ribosomal protein L23
MREYEVIKYPLATEKAVRMMESENKLTFIVDRKSTKKEIKESIEKMFNVKVLKVNTMINNEGKKKAFIKLSPENLAMDVATKLGLM